MVSTSAHRRIAGLPALWAPIVAPALHHVRHPGEAGASLIERKRMADKAPVRMVCKICRSVCAALRQQDLAVSASVHAPKGHMPTVHVSKGAIIDLQAGRHRSSTARCAWRCGHTPGLAGSHTGGWAGGIETPLCPRALRASDGMSFENRRQSIKIDKLPDDLA